MTKCEHGFKRCGLCHGMAGNAWPDAQLPVERLVIRKLSCDQVVWVMNVFDRYLPPSKHVGASRERDTMKYAMLYEVMEAAGLEFEDDAAAANATPGFVRSYFQE